MNRLFAFILLCSLSISAFGQGTIQSIIPNGGIAGQSLDIVIQGSNTEFITGSVSVDMGPGIMVTQVDVRNSLTLMVSVEILPTAQSGPRDVKVISSGDIIELIEGFSIIEAGGSEVFAMLEINPTQTIYLSDFDPDHLELAPVLFRITVINDQKNRNLRTNFYLILEGEGLLVTAIKRHGEVLAGSSLTFDNREFDDFDLNEEKSDLVDQIMATGVLPPGVYTYRIEVLENGVVLATADAQNTLLNQSGDLVLLTPGSPLDEGPPGAEQIASQPLFQWISAANQFDLFLYEVEEGQNNTQEIVQSLPVFREFNIIGNSFLYPLSAEPLEKGRTYAWQLRAYYNNPGGNAFFDSPLYWFIYGDTPIDLPPIGSIEIIPNYLTLQTENVFEFDFLIRDIEGNTLELTPQWSVLPDEQFGIIDSDGRFISGKNPRIGAVEVRYGPYSDHCVIELEYGGGFQFLFLKNLLEGATIKVKQ